MPKIRALTEAGRNAEADRALDADICRTLRVQMCEKRLTKREVARRLGVTDKTVHSRIEHAGSMTIQQYRDMCRAIGLEVTI